MKIWYKYHAYEFGLRLLKECENFEKHFLFSTGSRIRAFQKFCFGKQARVIWDIFLVETFSGSIT